MAEDRLPPLTVEKMSQEQRAAAADISAGPRGAVIGPFVPLLRSPELMTRLQKVGEYLRYESPLDRRLFELTILWVARWWDQAFEWSYHHPLALQAGLAPAIVDALAEGRRPEGMDHAAAAVWDVLDELFRTRQVSDAAWAAAVAELGEAGVVEVVATAGYYTTLAVVMNAARTPAPRGPQLPDVRPGAGGATSLPAPVLHRTGDGPAVLLLHPLGVDRSFWDDAVAALDGFEVLTYDFPGHGATPVPEQPFGIAELAGQARALLAAAGVDRAVVVGVSLGGLVAMQMAAEAPDLVHRLVVVDAVAVYPQPLREMWRDRATRAPVEGMAPFVDPTLGLWFTADRLADGGEVVVSVRRLLLDADPRGYALTCRALEQADVTAVLDRITAPTLVVCGADDAPPFTAAATDLASRLPGGRVVWLAPARHAGVLEQPGQFRAALREFLAADRAEVPR